MKNTLIDKAEITCGIKFEITDIIKNLEGAILYYNGYVEDKEGVVIDKAFKCKQNIHWDKYGKVLRLNGSSGFSENEALAFSLIIREKLKD